MSEINDWICFSWAWNLSFGTWTDSGNRNGIWIKGKFEKFEIKERATSFIFNNAKSLISNTINVKQNAEIKLWHGGSSSRNPKYNNYAQKLV